MPLAFLGVHDLPLINATLNATATVLLLVAYAFIRQKKVDAHKKTMLAAFAVSCIFLICYLLHHYLAGYVKFEKPGLVRTIYLSILVPHTILAMTVPVLAIITLRYGLKREFAKHRKIARWTFPIWLFVSVTGVIVYVLLYQVEPML
jgi:uncharacterized membrane protein YozB (DUF420 family)